jgi:hypothetical protein
MTQDHGVAALPPLCPASPGAAFASPPSGAAANALAGLRALAAHADKLQKLARQAETAMKAGTWLHTYGDSLANEGASGWTVDVRLSFARGCSGSEEAAGFIERAIYDMRKVVISHALALAEDAIEEPFKASAIEAAKAGETALAGSTEGESAVPKGDAQ